MIERALKWVRRRATEDLSQAPRPAGVQLSRGQQGVVHIRARDLAGAMWGMGYGHAADRGMQMLMMRILGQGRASELLSDDDEMVAIDTFFRRMHWTGGIDAELAQLDDETTAMCEAYCDGVNARLSRSLPWELRMLGVHYEPWRVADIIMMTRMVGYLTLAQSQSEAERLLVEMVQAGIDDERLSELFGEPLQGLERQWLQRVTLGERIVPDAVKWLTAAPPMMGSNNWVVAPAKTASGAAMLANDPHLEVNRLPAVWCEQVLTLPDRYAITMTMPGLPAALLGRSRDLAWGATYTFMDAVDSWIEHVRDGCYRRGEDSWQPFVVRKEVLRRKKRGPLTITFYENDHGVLDGDPSKEGYYLTTRWASGDCGAQSLKAARLMWDVTDVERGMEVLGSIETAWNWVLADRAGNIGYQMSGRMPLRDEAALGLVPEPGWDERYDWRGYVPPQQLPRQYNPACGYIVTANQDLNEWCAGKPITMPMGDYRAWRIGELLKARDDHDVDSFRRIQLDEYSVQAKAFLDILEPLLPDTANGRALRMWDYRYDPDSRGAALFEAFYDALREEMFAPFGLGHSVVRHLAEHTGIFIDFYANFDRILLAERSAWHGERSRESIYRKAFERIAQRAPQRWGDRQQITMTHMLFAGKLPRALGFDIGPLPLSGGRATPRQGQTYQSGGRATSFAPSARLIADMAEDGLHTSLAGGPSDRRFSPWYTSGLDDWLAGRLKYMHAETD